MPEFDPLAQELVSLLLPHVSPQEQQDLQTWLHEYGIEIDPEYKKDLYIKLSYALMLKIGEEASHEREYVMMRDYETWVHNPTEETKYTVKKQKNRLLYNVRLLEEARISTALSYIASIAGQSRRNPDTIINIFINATIFDREAVAERDRLYSLIGENRGWRGVEGWREAYQEYDRSQRLIITAERIKVLKFCLSEFQRIANSPINVLHGF
jgi:hypothetical protein